MREILGVAVGLLVILTSVSACQGRQPGPQTLGETGGTLQIESDAFESEGAIPQRYTCDGEDLSPSLSWSESPAGTQSLVLICDDPDAPVRTWNHWLLFNIPATARSLPEGIPADPTVEGAGTHGANSWHQLGYGGPCPPKGSAHRYYFQLYALDISLGLGPGASKNEVERAMMDHVLAEGQLMGQYSR
jgi:Raf kinase inhibitor-like YbhB/YbcL family protein